MTSTASNSNVPPSLRRKPSSSEGVTPEEDEEDDSKDVENRSGLFGTSANLVNTIVGAGIIGIPYAFKQSGWIAGLLLLAFVGYLTDASLRIIINLATFHPKLRHFHVRTYEKLASFPFGSTIGRGFVLTNMFILAYGAMVAYLLIIKDTVPTLLFNIAPNKYEGLEREIILIGTSLLIILPLSMFKDMSTLAFTSTLSVAADVLLVIFILAFSPVQESVSNAGGFTQILKQDSIEPGLFIGLGVLSTAMACQHSAFIISGSLRDLTRERWSIVTGCSIFTATLLCAALGSAGYLGFMDQTQGDVLNNFEADSLAANGARSLLAITMFFTYPMEAFVARHVLFSLIDHNDLDGDIPTTSGCGGMCNRRHVMTLAIYVLTLIPALIFDDLGPVLSITGAIGASSISFIAPGVIFLGVNGEAFVTYCHSFLLKREGSSKSENNSSNDHIELPVAGDFSQQMQQQTTVEETPRMLPVAGQARILSTIDYHVGAKPWWWWLLGFPVWYSIAFKGMQGMHESCSEVNNQEPCFQLHDPPVGLGDDEILSNPKGRDYFLAVVFIIFGVTALIAGLTANIWFIVHGY